MLSINILNFTFDGYLVLSIVTEHVILSHPRLMWRCETLFECNWRQFVCLFDLLARKLIWNWNVIVTFWENEEQKISVKVRLHCKLCILLNFSVGSLPLCHSLPTSLPCNHKFDVKQTGQKGLKLNSNGTVTFFKQFPSTTAFSGFHTSKNTFETMGYKSDGNLRNGGQMNGKLETKPPYWTYNCQYNLLYSNYLPGSPSTLQIWRMIKNWRQSGWSTTVRRVYFLLSQITMLYNYLGTWICTFWLHRFNLNFLDGYIEPYFI